jgi:hypothetical protein
LLSSPLSQSHAVAASSLVTATISLADTAHSLIEKLQASELDKTLVYNYDETIEENDVGDVLKDVDMNSVAVKVKKE